MSIFFAKLENLPSLNQISTRYTVFEEGQVLTSGQLNDLTRYLDDQIRLTRAGLIGVGIAGGLRVSLAAGRVSLARGAGVTTDGDVLWVPADTLFDRFKPYAENAPEYDPFQSGEGRIPLYELVAADAPADPLAAPLSAFEGDLRAMVGVLLMESYVKDDDLCSGTDCDNLGQDSVHVIKLLLTDQVSARQLAESLATPDRAARQLGEIVADRPSLSKVDSVEALASEYRTICDGLHGKLTAALGKLYPALSTLIGDLFPTDPAPAWTAKLEAIKANAAKHAAIQYYCGFLKDLAETYNAFRSLLFGVTAVRCPEVGAFPKHLLLGDLDAGPDGTANRTGFYPSPAAGDMEERWSHARFLLRKLAALIETFQLPLGEQIFFPLREDEDRSTETRAIAPTFFERIRITPSHGEDRSLEERAIPFYYRFDNPGFPIHRSWSWELERRGMSDWNYSYWAKEYGAKGGAAAPFASQIGRFSFFRVEGHLGASVATAKAELENLIKLHNLPIAVRSVLLDSNKGAIVKDPRIIYTDLHHFHDLLRLEAVHQLDEAAGFSQVFKTKVDQVVDAEKDGAALKVIAERNSAAVTTRATAAKSKLSRSFSEFTGDSSWKEDVREVMRASGEFKADLGKVVKTEFTTPFDTVIGSTPLQMVDWLGDIIETREGLADDQLLFANFRAQHPGLEHFAGVGRGGTFVLVYDSASNVIADFTLPYLWTEAVQAEPETPLPVKPSLRPEFVVDGGITIQPSRETFVETLVTPKLSSLETRLKPTIDLQSQVFKVFSDSVSVMTTAATRPVSPSLVTPAPLVPPGNEFLHLQLQETQVLANTVDYLRRRAVEPGADAVALEGQINEVELELARKINSTTNYIATSGMDVKVGSEGFNAIVTTSSLAGKLSSEEAVATAKEGFALARENPDLTPIINVVRPEES
jgi:hypothetical protein